MARRRVFHQESSSLALWSRRLAVFALLVMVLAAVIVRGDFLEIKPALAIIGAALSFAALAILLALGAFAAIWVTGASGLGQALAAILIAALLLGYPAYLGVLAYRLPAISDITTDEIEPPAFDAVARLRPRDANPVTYAGLYAAEQQRVAYPDIQSLSVDMPADKAFEQVTALIKRRKWRVVSERPPRPGRDGSLEAIARTFLMGFRDDVAIRVRADGESTQIDMRSASRYGRNDFGTNAARIKNFLDELDELISAQLDRGEKERAKPRKPPERKPAKKN